MALRLIDTFIGTNGKTAKVYRDVQWNEYRVKLWRGGEYLKNADAHTDDKDDAYATARYECGLSNDAQPE